MNRNTALLTSLACFFFTGGISHAQSPEPSQPRAEPARPESRPAESRPAETRPAESRPGATAPAKPKAKPRKPEEDAAARPASRASEKPRPAVKKAGPAGARAGARAAGPSPEAGTSKARKASGRKAPRAALPAEKDEKEEKEEKKDPRQSTWRMVFYSTAALAAASFVAAGVLSWKNQQVTQTKNDHLLDVVRSDPAALWVYSSNVCGASGRDSRTDDLCKQGKRYSAAAKATLAIGSVALAGSVVFAYLGFFRSYEKEKPKKKKKAPSVDVGFTGSVAQDGASAGVVLSF